MKKTVQTAAMSHVSALQRESLLQQRGCVVWLTGLSGSGKSTLAAALEEYLVRRGYLAFMLDGDRVRAGLNRALGFSRKDRRENIRRVAEVAALFADAGVICITAFISPFRADRAKARRIVGTRRFLEVHANADLAICEQRDVKKLYRKARAGALPDFTGVSQPYEEPLKPALRVDTGRQSVRSCMGEIVAILRKRGMLLGNRRALKR